MTFEEMLDQAIAMLQRRGRVTYRTLQLQFTLDDEQLAALKDELLYSQPQVRDDTGRGLIWTEDAGPVRAGTASPVEPPAQAPLTYTPPYLAEKILTSRSALEGERKQVTVLFADLKGSTELIRDLDPEAAQLLLDPALHHMMDAVHQFEGTVNQVLGDGIMALFGAPVAHEDHAVRACYAALAMQTALRRYAEDVRRAHGLEMQARVGLNSGEVVVRSIGNDLHMDYSAVGPTTHLAARMEQLALPGSIRLTAATLRLVEDLVQVNALGQFPVKGLSESVDVFELIGASTVRRRLQASAARGLTRFVGRETELAALVQALERAGAGHGQVVAVVGEAGVGKSRLVYEFVHLHHTSGWLVLESASVSYGKATPYFPVIDLLKRYSHVEERDDTRSIRAKVTGQVLTLDPALQDAVPALLSLLDALPEDSPFVQLDPPQRRQRTLDALKRLLLRESQEQPLLLVFEDLHWIDSETQALLDSVVESLPTTRVLLLVNYRPEYQHGWGSKTSYAQLRLDPLPPASAEQLLATLLGHDPSLQEQRRTLHARIVEALEGLYADHLAEQVERLAHHALRGEVWNKALAYCRQAGAKAAEHSAYREAVTYIEQALQALSHLPERRETLEQAIDLRLDLRQAFFALIAHRSMLNPLREAAVLAEALGDQRRLGYVSAYLSQYCWAMGDQERALVSGQRALACAETLGDVILQGLATLYLSQASNALGEHQQAIAYSRRSVASFEGAQRRERCGLPYLPSVFSRTLLSGYLAMVGAFAESIAVAEEGVQIAEATDHPLSRITAYIGMGSLYRFKGDVHLAIPILERSLAICQAANIPPWPILSSSLGTAYALCGRVTEALPLLEQAVEHGNAVGLLANQPLFIAYLSQGYLRAGRGKEATQSAQRALELARARKARGWEAEVLCILGDVARHRAPSASEQAEAHYRQAIALADELGMRPLQAHCHRGLGMLYAATGQPEQASTELATAIKMYQSMNMTFWRPQTEAARAQVEAH